MAEEIDIPKIGKLPKKYVYVIGGATVVYVGYRWWQSSKATSEEPVITPPEDDTYGGTGSSGGSGFQYAGTGNSSVDTTDPTTNPKTNQQWTQNAVAYADSLGWPTAEVASAIGKYLRSEGLTATEQTYIKTVLAAVGSPPVGGPYTVISSTAPTPSSLPAPTGLKIDAVTSNTVKLSWNQVSGAIGYSITEAKTGTNVVAYAPSGTSVIVQNLQPNTSYTYYVAARNSANQRGALSAGVTAKTSGLKLSAPTGLKARTVTATGITFQWNTVPGVQAYVLQPAGSVSTNIESTDPVQTVTGLKPNTTYRFRVAAFQPGTRTTGPWSGYVSVKTKAR